MRLLNWCLAAWIGLAQIAVAENFEQGLIVTGIGTVTAEPDMATLVLGVTNTGATAGEAMQANAEAVSSVIGSLDDQGIADRDRQTSRFYLRPLWADQARPGAAPPQITGYEAGNSVTVRIRELASLGAVLDAVIAVGGNDFNGLSFGVQEDSGLKSNARKAAVADAMARAVELAEAAGVTLGAIVKLTESGDSGGPQMMESFSRSASMGDAVASGEVAFSAYVTMVFDIMPKP